MDLCYLGALWNDNYDLFLQYLNPNQIVLLSTTNKKMLSYIQAYFSRIAKKYPCTPLKKVKNGDHDRDFRWIIDDTIIKNALIWYKYKDKEFILNPKITRRRYSGLRIYGWVIWDSRFKHEYYGKYPEWFHLREGVEEGYKIRRFIPYR